MTDRWALVAAVAVVAGAHLGGAVPLAVLALVAVAWWTTRHPALACVALLLLASELGHRADAGLRSGPEGPVLGEVLLVSDPQPSGRGVRADGRLGSHRVLLRATGPAAEALAPRLAGEIVRVSGEAEPADPAPWLRARHLASRVTVWQVEGWREGPPVARLANGLRRTLERGAEPLDVDDRSLFTGLVLGDDRAQTPERADDFRATGLTHLQAVSGQNVVVVLALFAPLLRRLRLWPRLFAALAVIGLFGLVTRFEPSVLRASGMAVLTVAAMTIGRPQQRLRILAAAVAGLVLIDPMLVHAVGFQLSAAASAGIITLAAPIARALPGPRAVREPMAVTIAAECGVAPVLVAVFGPMPLVSVPANFLAVPAKGLVIVWGLTGGLVAGLLGGEVAELLHVPTRALVRWIAWVARRAAALPVGELSAPRAALTGVGVVLAATLRHRPWLARTGAVVALAVVVLTVAAASAPPPLRVAPAPGVVVWRAGGGTAVELSAAGGRLPPTPRTVLEEVRRAGVRAVDLLIVADGRVDDEVVAALGRRYAAPPVAMPAGARRPAAPLRVEPVPPAGATYLVGDLELTIVPAGGRLTVDGRPLRRGQ